MNERMKEYLKYFYDSNRIFWLFLSCATICHIILTSEEIWKIINGGIIIYFPYNIIVIIVLLTMNLFVRHSIFNKIIENKTWTIIFSLMTLFFEITVFSSMAFITLAMINVTSIKILNTIGSILITTLPIALGAAALPSITLEYLENRLAKLQKKIEEHESMVEALKELDLEIEEELEKLEAKKKG